MTTENQPPEQEQRAQIWEQLDREDAGVTSPALEAKPEEVTQGKPEAEAPQGANGVEQPPESGAPEEPLSPREQAFMDKLSGMEQAFNSLSTRVRNTEGNLGGLKAEFKDRMQKLQASAARAGVDAPTTAQIDAAAKGGKAMQELQEEYPQFGKAMKAALDEHLSQVVQPPAPAPAEAPPPPPVATPEDLESLRREMTVEARHPGWQTVVATSEFGGWLGRQSREIQLLARSSDPADAIRLLDIHADQKKQTDPTARLRSAAALPTGRQAAARSKPVSEMTGQEYWAYLDAQEQRK